ncbi:MAG: carbamoyl phosphate synthase small subunit [Faecalibacterium sp.]|nr:carbamoyl phosphate synthase small subunit [Ruminococcus sp.]MCM1484810.1 carbamoyl phosphate synthase small subunit [Faecalibacterium sp.]
MKKRYLVLADGTVFEGIAFGADCECVGELVFTTGMVGYIETLTDPSYCGQIVIQTFPMIGNYGVISEDFEGQPLLNGYVVREKCDYPSNFRCEYDLDTFLKNYSIPGIYGVDTRELTNIIREHGVINASLCDRIPENLEPIKEYKVTNSVETASTKQPEKYPATVAAKYEVILIDYGAKMNIVRSLCERGCNVTVVPFNTSAEDILGMNPDGIMLSNGPGDPADNTYSIKQIKKLLGKVPLFGICLGHQLTALADGGRTVKLKYGHRGANQPCKNLATGRTYITSQNHGYAVVGDSTEHGVESFINANDGTTEGMNYPTFNAFTVQFHPEACGGPHDTSFLFDKFIDLMEENKNASL